MAHGDDAGPGAAAQRGAAQLVIVPIFRTEDDRVAVAGAIERLEAALAGVQTVSGPLRYKVDWREETRRLQVQPLGAARRAAPAGDRPRDVAAGQGVLVRRIDRAKEPIALDAIAADLPGRLAAYQAEIFQRALDFRTANTHWSTPTTTSRPRSMARAAS